MISVNSERLKNPANTAKNKKKDNKESLIDNRNRKKAARGFLGIILGLLILLGAWQLGVFHSLAYNIDNVWNNTTKAMGLRLKAVQLVGYEIRDQEGELLGEANLDLPKDEILEALGLTGVQPGEYALMALDPKQLRAQLEQLSWVQAAAVQRVLPNTIRIHIVPRTAFVMMQEGTKISMLNSFGNSLPMQKGDINRKILRITGNGSFKASLDLINILAEEPELLNQIKLAERVSERRWNIYLTNGLLIKMPEDDELKAWKKLAELKNNQALFTHAVDQLDLRYKDHLIVRGDFRPQTPNEKNKKGV